MLVKVKRLRTIPSHWDNMGEMQKLMGKVVEVVKTRESDPGVQYAFRTKDKSHNEGQGCFFAESDVEVVESKKVHKKVVKKVVKKVAKKTVKKAANKK